MATGPIGIWSATRARVALWARQLDWPLAVLAGGFLATLPCAIPAHDRPLSLLADLSRWVTGDPVAEFSDGVAALARHIPVRQKPLTGVLGEASVTLVTFGYAKPPLATGRDRTLWATTEDELKGLCGHNANPGRRFVEGLGMLPGDLSGRMVWHISVHQQDVFRPCLSLSDNGAASCGTTVPAPEGADLKARDADKIKAWPAMVAWTEKMRFLAQKLFDATRPGLHDAEKAPPGGVDRGSPFTGMGWSYDLGDEGGHFGPTEFVVLGSKEIAIAAPTNGQSPAEFCKALPPPPGAGPAG